MKPKPIVIDTRYGDKRPLTGMEQMRELVRLFDNCNESFNDLWTAEQLLKLYRMYKLCGWDIAPDKWDRRQVKEAFRGKVPQWDDAERPVYEETAKAE